MTVLRRLEMFILPLKDTIRSFWELNWFEICCSNVELVSSLSCVAALVIMMSCSCDDVVMFGFSK